MVELSLTKRPVVLELPASASMLTSNLDRIARLRGRASGWGVSNDATLAEYMVGEGFEADFRYGYYRDGFVEGDLSGLRGWSFARASAGLSLTEAGLLTSFASGAPRITDRGLLMEEAATNRWLHAKDFSNAAWTLVGATVSANSTTGPNGATEADKLVESSASETHLILQYEGDSRTISVYAKPAGREWIALRGGNDFVWFHLSGDGAIGTNQSQRARIRKVANGFYRCSAYFSAPENVNRVIYLATGDGVTTYAGDGTSGVHLFGGQAEDGERASSLIETTSSAATRAGDTAVTLPLNLRDEGAFYIEAEVGDRGTLMSADRNVGIVDYLALGREAGSDNLILVNFQDSVAQTRTKSGYGNSAVIRAVVGWKGDQLHFTADGDDRAPLTLTRGMRLDRLRPGGTFYGGDMLGGYVRKLTVLPKLPSAAARIAMTES